MSSDHDALAQGFQAIDNPGGTFARIIGPFYVRGEPEGDNSYAFRVGPYHISPAGDAHGGVLIGFVELASANAALSENEGAGFALLSHSAAFLNPALLGELVVCRPRITRRTREILFFHADCQVGARTVLSINSLWQPRDKDHTSPEKSA